MRRRQLVELLWQDVDLDRAELNLRAESSKTRREWQIPIADELLPVLHDLRERTCLARGAVDPLRQVFCLPLFAKRGFAGESLRADYLSHWFNDLQRCLPEGQRAISAHRLRHTIATRLARSGCSIRALQTLLGHTSVNTTLGYVGVDMEDLRGCVARLPPPTAGGGG